MLGEKQSLKNKEKKIEQKLNYFQQYKNTNLSLKELLEATGQFLTQQIAEIEKDFVEVSSDSADERLPECSTPQELKKFCQILESYKENISTKIGHLEQKKEFVKVKTERHNI